MPPTKRKRGKQSARTTARQTPTEEEEQHSVETSQQHQDESTATNPVELEDGKVDDSAMQAEPQTEQNATPSTPTKLNSAIPTTITNLPESTDLILTSSKRRGVFECDYCHCDISQLPRIRCAVCDDFDLCCDCFTANLGDPNAPIPEPDEDGKPKHDPTRHGYRVCDSSRYPAFPTAKQWSAWLAKHEKMQISNDPEIKVTSEVLAKCTPVPLSREFDAGVNTHEKPSEDSAIPEDEMEAVESSFVMDPTVTETWNFKADDPRNFWTIEEDLRLLEGIETQGLGNWNEIAEIVNAGGQGSMGKTPKRCMERYLDDYLGRYGHILPPYTVVGVNDSEMPLDEETVLANPGIVTSPAPTSDTNTMASSNAPGDGTSAKTDEDASLSLTSTPVPAHATLTPGTLSEIASAISEADMPRASKRRAALMRTPVTASVVGPASMASRKKYKVVPTESLPGYDEIWPKPYYPSKTNPYILAGNDVGRDQMYRAEQNFVKATSSAQSKEEVEKIHQEWRESKLLKVGGPTVLPLRTEDILEYPGSELAGFMPRRGDFDVEWENDAEETIGDMEFLPGDTAEERKIKMKVLQIYNEKLDKREARKKFIISRKLWDYRKLHQQNETLPQDERDLAHRMRLFERFHTPEEHKKFLDDVLKAKRLRKEIAKLQMYRRLGIRTRIDAEKYELDKARRLFHKNAAASAKANDKGQDGDGGKKDGKNNGPSLDPAKDDTTASTSLWRQYRTNDRRSRKSVNRGGEVSDAAASAAAAAARSDPMDVDSSTITKSAPDTPSRKPEPAFAASPTSPQRTHPKSTTLTPQELDLCEKIGLTSVQYREIKKVLIQESLQAGLLDKEGSGSSRRALLKLDVERRGDLINFMLRAGWVSTRISHIASTLPVPQGTLK